MILAFSGYFGGFALLFWAGHGVVFLVQVQYGEPGFLLVLVAGCDLLVLVLCGLRAVVCFWWFCILAVLYFGGFPARLWVCAFW